MLALDPRAGSGDLLRPLKRRGVPVEPQELEFGDAAFFGSGGQAAGEMPIHVGIEVKRISDVLQCIHDGRFAGHQLPGLLRLYDVVWLVVEGGYRASANGVLELPVHKGARHRWVDYASYTGSTRQVMWRSVQHWLTTMEMRAGIRVARTLTHEETADWIAALYSWWQKDWDDHRSHLALYAGRDIGVGDGAVELFTRRPNLVGFVAQVLPGIGAERAHLVQKHFTSVEALVAADEAEWVSIKGIGKVTAKKVVEALRARA